MIRADFVRQSGLGGRTYGIWKDAVKRKQQGLREDRGEWEVGGCPTLDCVAGATRKMMMCIGLLEAYWRMLEEHLRHTARTLTMGTDYLQMVNVKIHTIIIVIAYLYQAKLSRYGC